jgi:DNA-binding CsgD family transcriptional regulator
MRAMCAFVGGDPETARATRAELPGLQDAVAALDEGAFPVAEATFFAALGLSGADGAAVEGLRALTVRFKSTGASRGLASLLTFYGQSLMRMGEITEAFAILSEAAMVGREQDSPPEELNGLGWGALAEAFLRRPDERLTTYAEAAQLAEDQKAQIMWCVTDTAAGLHLLAGGKVDEARSVLLACAQRASRSGMVNIAHVPWAIELAEASIRLQDNECLVLAETAIHGNLQRWDRPLLHGWAYRIDALKAGDAPHAERLFGLAIQAHREDDRRVELGRSLLLYGGWLRRARRIGEARQHLREAHDLLLACGAGAFLAAAERELAASGVAVTSVQRAPGLDEALADLTPQERSITEAAARGASNRVIADQLFLSPKTVEHHLTSIYRKLGVRSRSQLSALLAGQITV